MRTRGTARAPRGLPGVAAVLDKPMRDRPVTFNRPHPFFSAEGAPVIRDGKQAGDVLRAWVDGTPSTGKATCPALCSAGPTSRTMTP
ncbi:hypothetical protein AB0O39_27475 [Streptomyces anulatus]|uniref:hypothetical protein n=1 Tax=Streptomyces anulatus TaxID=1892 RepID=UPI0034364D7C